MSHVTTEKKISKYTKGKFELTIDKDDHEELIRLYDLKHEYGVATSEAEITFRADGCTRTLEVCLRFK